MNKGRLAVIGVVAVAVAFLGGLVSGTMGRSAVERERDQAELRVNVERGRVAILHGRLELFSMNFGGATRQFDAARGPLEAAREKLNSAGRSDKATRLDTALRALVEAQQMSLALNREADAKAVEALRGLEGIE